MIPSAGLPTYQPLLYSMEMLKPLRSNSLLSLYDGTAVVIICRCDESGKDLLLIATCGSRRAALIGYTMVGRWVELLQIM
jgi:hypothetical protein